MAGPDRHETNIPVTGIVTILLALTSAFIIQQGPLLSSRPTGGLAEHTVPRVGNVQNVEARLWEDPFAAVDRHRRDKTKGEAPSGDAKDRDKIPPQHRTDRFVAQIARDMRGSQTVAVLPVMVFGGPYPEDGEHRRRMRYATLSALKESGYVPEDAEYVGYIELAPGQRAIAGSDAPLPAVVPYEWFGADRPGLPQRLLVLWIDELAFQQHPLGRLDALFSLVLPSADAGTSIRHALPVVVVGPAGSNSLKAMVTELRATTPPRLRWLTALYSPTTTSEMGVSRKATGAALEDELVREFRTRGEIAFLRVSVPDTIVMRHLVDELGHRGLDLIRPGAPPGCRGLDHVALIAEWDTEYGRTLPRAFKSAMRDAESKAIEAAATNGRAAPSPSGCEEMLVHSYSYMRGLDGRLHRGAASSNGDRKDKEEAKPEAGDEGRERAEGNSQVDYLRRLALRLREEDRQRQHDRGGRIRAIGVLGSDVYDKLLVLQAIRGDFPEAVLFTTDLDARLIRPGEFQSTRNLIVASGYGLQLHGALQSEIAPFRGTDQTATFLTTRLAVDRLIRSGTTDEANRATEAAQRRVEAWKASASVFEIGRTGAVELTPSTAGPECASVATCTNPRAPAVGYYAQHLRPGAGRMAFAGVVLGVLLLYLSSWTVRGVAHRAWGALRGQGERTRPGLWAVALLLVGGAWIGVNGLRRVLAGPDSEPFALFEGISVWPTEAIRALALVVAGHGFVCVCRKLVATRRALTERFFPGNAEALFRFGAGRRHVRTWRGWGWILAGIRPPGPAVVRFGVERAWREHMFQSSCFARVARVGLMVVLFMGLGFVLARWGFSPPNVPYRGWVTLQIDRALLYSVVLLFLGMLFIVVDEIRLCDKLAHGLARPTPSDWPSPTLARFRRDVDVPDGVLASLVDIRLVAEWTTAVMPLVYYPAVVMVLMLIARSPLLDAWDMPLGLLLVFVISAIYTLSCAVILRRAAERVRAYTLRSLDATILRATDQPDGDRLPAGRLRLLRETVESIREGAFAPLSQQPVVKAILLAVSSGSGLVVVQYLMTR